uniref:Major histocompatibility complex class I UBA n=1 Tax=Scleropages formosus TaxID=113540 RepID=A0A8C9RM92_SCLFO
MRVRKDVDGKESFLNLLCSVIILFFFVCACLVSRSVCVFAATHSLRYVYSGTSGILDFPEFTIVGLVDEEQFVYYDSNIRRTIPRVEWVNKAADPDYWNRNTQNFIGAEQVFKNNIEVAKKRFNQTGGIHTVQQMYGCEWDDDTGTTGAHRQFGYDGEDFITLDMKTMNWVTPVIQAFPTKEKWNNDKGLTEINKNYFNQECIEWLKKYVGYGKETLQRKVRPEVSLLQKDSPSSVSCYATGFFPKSIVINWQKDGKEIHDDVETTELLPNGDGSFQIRSILRVSPEDLKNHQFSCVVDHVSLDEKMVKKWGDNMLPIIIGCVVVALLAICAAAAFFVWKKKNEGEK